MTAERQRFSRETLEYEPRLLVVDCVVQTAEIVDRHLRAHGFACRVRGAATEPELRAALREYQPHVILAAARSANGLDGIDVLEIVRTEAPDTAFLFWGELPDEALATEALQVGAADFIPKSEPARLVPAMYRALRDVAARRTRRLAEQRIRESERRLHDIVEASQEWLWELDATGRLVYSSDSVQRILGHAPRQLLGNDFLQLVHAEDRGRFQSALQKLDSTAPMANGIVARWQGSSGEYRQLEASVALANASGAVTGYRGALRDVTERCEQEERIAQLTRMLRMQSGLIDALLERTAETAHGSDG